MSYSAQPKVYSLPKVSMLSLHGAGSQLKDGVTVGEDVSLHDGLPGLPVEQLNGHVILEESQVVHKVPEQGPQTMVKVWYHQPMMPICD